MTGSQKKLCGKGPVPREFLRTIREDEPTGSSAEQIRKIHGGCIWGSVIYVPTTVARFLAESSKDTVPTEMNSALCIQVTTPRSFSKTITLWTQQILGPGHSIVLPHISKTLEHLCLISDACFMKGIYCCKILVWMNSRLPLFGLLKYRLNTSGSRRSPRYVMHFSLPDPTLDLTGLLAID